MTQNEDRVRKYQVNQLKYSLIIFDLYSKCIGYLSIVPQCTNMDLILDINKYKLVLLLLSLGFIVVSDVWKLFAVGVRFRVGSVELS